MINDGEHLGENAQNTTDTCLMGPFMKITSMVLLVITMLINVCGSPFHYYRFRISGYLSFGPDAMMVFNRSGQ